MPVDPDSVTTLSDFSLSKTVASVIIHRIETGAVKIRKATEFRKLNLEKCLKEKKLVSDPRRDTESLDYRIIFYGKEDLAKSLVDSLKTSDIESQFSVSTPATNRASETTKRSTRNTENQAPNTNQDFVKILSIIRDEQLEIKQLLNKFEVENLNLKNKVDELLERGNYKKNRLTVSEAGELIQYCTAEVAKRRLDKKFEDKLSQIPWDRVNVNNKQKKNILDELRWERRISKMISTIGEIIYGETLLTHILGRNGKRERSRRETERAHVISLEQERRLRDILGVFDDLFTSDKAWKAIVQHHINQKGRDAKKANKRFNDESSDTNSDESDEEKTPVKKRKQNNDKVSPNDTSGSREEDFQKTDDVQTDKTGGFSSENEREDIEIPSS